MKTKKQLCVYLLFCVITLVFSSCSSGLQPCDLGNESLTDTLNEQDLIMLEQSGKRRITAAYHAVIDVENRTFEITPHDRISEYHLPLNLYFPNVLSITAFGFTPNLWADIRLTHPFAGSGIDGYDARVIAILPISQANSFNYQELECRGNHAVVMEPDGYIKLHDNLAPAIEGNTNPFLAYFKNEPNRIFASTGTTQETRRWNMEIEGFSGDFTFMLVVDISTNFPTPPQPVIDNAQEPVEIIAEVGEGITPEGGGAEIHVTLLDWQGPDDIHPVCVVCPDLFNGVVQLDYDHPGLNPNEYVFVGRISNDKRAPEGVYHYFIAAFDEETDVAVYDEFELRVAFPIILDPVDITPDQLNFSPYDVHHWGGYAFIAGGVNGLHMIDVSDPYNPLWIRKINTPGVAHGVYVENGYAFVTAEEAGLHIIDIDPPHGAGIVKTVPTMDWAFDVVVRGEYAYIADDWGGFTIADLNPLETAHVVGNISLPNESVAVEVSGDYAYVVNHDYMLHIVDITDPANPALIRTVTTSGFGEDISISGNYAYVACWDVDIVNISRPGSANVINTVETPGFAMGIDTVNGHAFVADYFGEFITLDISNPGEEYIMDTLITPGSSDRKVHAYGDYACVVDDEAGLNVINISPPHLSYVTGWVFSPGQTFDAFVSEGYAYVANDYAGLMLMDVEPIEYSYSIFPHDTPDSARSAYVMDNYVYVTDYTTGLLVFEILTPGEIVLRKTISFTGHSVDVALMEGYAFVASLDYGLKIIDIEPLNSAYVYATVHTPGLASGVFVQGGYAYVADGSQGLQIVDIDPISYHVIVKNVPTYDDANAVTVREGYAFVADFNWGVEIIDVEPVEEAYLVKTVSTPGSARDVDLTDKYLLTACWDEGLQIIDISDANTASVVDEISTPGYADGVFAIGNLAYVCDRQGGLRIIQLWE